MPGPRLRPFFLGIPDLADEVPRHSQRAREQPRRPRALPRTIPVSGFLAGSGCPIFLRRGASGYVELLHTVRTGITHQPERVPGYFLTGYVAAFRMGRFVSAYLML